MCSILNQDEIAPMFQNAERSSETELGQIANLYNIELDCGVDEEQDIFCSSVDSLLARIRVDSPLRSGLQRHQEQDCDLVGPC